MPAAQLVALKCSIARGAFSDERVFTVALPQGEYTGIASRRYCWNERDEPLNQDEPAAGRSIGQAFVYAYYLERACEYQLQALATGARLKTLPQEIIELVPKQGKHIPRSGQLEWPALMALLDDADSSFRD